MPISNFQSDKGWEDDATMGSVKRQSYNSALLNMARYDSLKSIQNLLSNMGNLRQLAEKGDSVALSIVIDLEKALLSDRLTDKQKLCLQLKYSQKYTNNQIKDMLGMKSDNSVRKHLQGGLKRLRRELGGDG